MSEIKNLSASIQSRLRNKAHEINRPYNELLQYYAIERFLYRLSRSIYSDKFILKGALLFLAWKTAVYRSTRDIDLLGYTSHDLENITRIIQLILIQEVEPDGVLFDENSIQSEQIQEDAEYEGARVSLIGYLGKARLKLQIDIGFSDIVSPAPIMIQYPTILQLPSPILRGYPPESVVAEKLQALVFLGGFNSRMKDFYDLWVLADKFEFDGQELQKAITRTFQHRNTPLPSGIPIGLSDAFAIENQIRWNAFIQRTQIDNAPLSLMDISRAISDFLLPPLIAGSLGNDFRGIWKPGGPWK